MFEDHEVNFSTQQILFFFGCLESLGCAVKAVKIHNGNAIVQENVLWHNQIICQKISIRNLCPVSEYFFLCHFIRTSNLVGIFVVDRNVVLQLKDYT